MRREPMARRDGYQDPGAKDSAKTYVLVFLIGLAAVLLWVAVLAPTR